ncbi:MAG: esterase family protein [candidate division KSB1 bacterium]|nr:esterase family protein [candidate division KSB1 bacterium]MDZ7272567.1 esterase family protein [candidate division KSB1 bacterium]MDZ7284410.1 esterase family protein [candidate division KSB1 bacterium]MDZ7297194.1 esterase family protein [candidate division KSB1 bacterium]MDZ7308097.1 esterase family protein [candidate division KSB1 bacterium]
MPSSTRANIHAEILARHANSLHGTLRLEWRHSPSLQCGKACFVYEPPGYQAGRAAALLYLFRGHEREWCNFHEDASRRRSTAIEDLDALIHSTRLPPVVVVMPGLNSADNAVPSLGIDMVGVWPAKHKGLGTGRFWQYLTSELLPEYDRRYVSAMTKKLMAGFSLGGFTVSLLAAKRPGYFEEAAIYDGTLMWPGHRDPRQGDGDNSDRIWLAAPLFNAALGKPRSRRALRVWNATDGIAAASGETARLLRRTRFWVASTAHDGLRGNRDRAEHFRRLLQEKGCRLGFAQTVLHPRAEHNWHWADRFLVRFLQEALSPP